MKTIEYINSEKQFKVVMYDNEPEFIDLRTDADILLKKTSIQIYRDKLIDLGELEDEQKGRLFQAIVDYDIDGTIPEFGKGDLILRLMFNQIRNGMDSDNAKYVEKARNKRRSGLIKAYKNHELNLGKLEQPLALAMDTDTNTNNYSYSDTNNYTDNNNYTDTDFIGLLGEENQQILNDVYGYFCENVVDRKLSAEKRDLYIETIDIITNQDGDFNWLESMSISEIVDAYKGMIDIYAVRDFGIDVNKSFDHFMSDGVLDKLAYEVLY